MTDFIMYFAKQMLDDFSVKYQALIRKNNCVVFRESSDLDEFVRELTYYCERNNNSPKLINNPPEDFLEQEQRFIRIFTNEKDTIGKSVLDELKRKYPDTEEFQKAYEKLSRVNYELRPLTEGEEEELLEILKKS